jgi:hypothetical protein
MQFCLVRSLDQRCAGIHRRQDRADYRLAQMAVRIFASIIGLAIDASMQ